MKKQQITTLVQTSLLVAIIVLMAFTPIGYLKVGLIEITFITIPVIIGAILMGPKVGALLGGVFGITSFIQCFGMSPFGATLLAINPFFTLIMCLIPRILMGLLCGLIFKGISKVDKTKFFSYSIASLSGALLNTIFFVAGLGLLFYNTEFIQNMVTQMEATNIFNFGIAFVGLNGLVEAIACFVIGTALTKVLDRFVLKKPAPIKKETITPIIE